MTYRNERFTRGKTVNILYNPYWTGKVELIGVDNTQVYVKNTGFPTYAYTGDVTTLETYGGLLLRSLDDDYVYVDISRDTFPNGFNFWNGYNRKYFDLAFFSANEFMFEDVVIMSREIKTKSNRYGAYPVNYASHDEHRIKVNLKGYDFDLLLQLCMSKQIAVESCDHTIDTDDIDGALKLVKPVSGGSFNPIVRPAIVENVILKNKIVKSEAIITLRLLG